jgi:hypothetical protein
MARASIFEKIKSNFDLEKELDRLDSLFTQRRCIYLDFDNRINNLNLKTFIDLYCFSTWTNRGHFLDLNDCLETLNFEELLVLAPFDEDALIDLLELYYNLYQLALEYLDEDRNTRSSDSNFDLFQKIIDDILERINFTPYYNDQTDQILLVQKDAAVTAVVEIEEDSSLAFEIIQYNHHALKGNIAKKKAILLRLGAQLEPKRNDLKSINPNLATNIFALLNNLNLRHNNTEPGNSSYIQCVADMKSVDLELWYDELYQMILLARLELDNVERMKKADELRKNF